MTLREFLIDRIYNWSKAAHLWTMATAVTDVRDDIDKKVFLSAAKRELDQVETSVLAIIEYRKSESDILNERLTRRFDVASAMNEAAQRAIAMKTAAKTDRDIQPLSGPQAMALEFQKKYLADLVKNA